MKTSILFVLVLALTAISATRVPKDGDKALNNLLSQALHNVRIDGQFLTNYPFSDLLRYPEANSCNRRLELNRDDFDDYEGGLKRVFQTGVLRIGVTSLVSLPYFSNATGTPQGFFYYLGIIVANEVGFLLQRPVQAQFIVIPTTNFLVNTSAALNAGIVDTVIGFSYLQSRLLVVDYTCWYEAPSPFAVYRDETTGLPAGFAIPSQLQGWNDNRIKVATLAGSIFENAINQYLPNVQKVYFPTMNDAYNAVGVSADIVFSIVGETIGYIQSHNNRLTEQEGTRTVFGGGNAFATRRSV